VLLSVVFDGAGEAQIVFGGGAFTADRVVEEHFDVGLAGKASGGGEELGLGEIGVVKADPVTDLRKWIKNGPRFLVRFFGCGGGAVQVLCEAR
jgi:hypothetical protein